MKDAVHYIVTHIVDNPDKVEITEAEDNGTIQFSITVAQEDIGKVIGKSGKVIRAIRNVLKIPAIKNNKKILVSVNEA